MVDFLTAVQEKEKVMDYLQKKVIMDLKKEYTEIVTEDMDLPMALMEIYQSTNIGFVFLIDEWDCIFRENRNDKEFQRKYLDFLRYLFKDKIYISMVYMTGILPIKKYGVHLALNMFTEYSMTDQSVLERFTGFTKEEVKKLCDKYDMDFYEMQRWYDGYRLGEHHVYNPKSTVESIIRKKFNNYWTNTETYEALKVYIDMNFDGLKDSIVKMLNGERVKTNIRRFQNDMTTFNSKDDVLTLLVHLGYFSEIKEVFIPNEEISDEYISVIEDIDWSEVINSIQQSEQLLEALWNEEEEKVAQMVDEVHMETKKHSCKIERVEK